MGLSIGKATKVQGSITQVVREKHEEPELSQTDTFPEKGSKSDDYLLVAAIDFGTTYSGYAYSMRGDFQKDPLIIHANQAWNAGSTQLMSRKTTTSLLLDERKQFISFGFEAENVYANKCLDGNDSGFYFFNRFKMKLHNNKNITKEMILEDVTGKPLSAMEVFALSIKSLVDHLLELLEKQGTGMTKYDVRWVLTVPAIWTDSAKQFMRVSAKNAGIPDENLFIALEPEAASIYCQYLPTEKLHGSTKGFEVTKIGSKYMIIDLGGGTADITLHEKLPDGELKEICRVDGNDCGGTSIDNAFLQLLINIVGAPLMISLKREDPGSYLDLFRAFENVKRTINSSSEGKINITIPFTSINCRCQNHLSEEFDTSLKNSKYANEITIKGDKIRIEAHVIKDLFTPTIDGIISLTKSVLEKKEANGTSLLLMVGGFSECRLVQDQMRKHFPGHRLIIPDQADLAVLKGAVLFGHKPKVIESRIIKTTYGVAMTAKFDPNSHDEKHKSVIDGVDKTRNLFNIIMKKDSSVPIGTKVCKSYSTTMKKQKEIKLSVYTTEIEDPKYVDDTGCSLLGEIVMAIENVTTDKRWFKFEFEFGQTEINIFVSDKTTGNLLKGTFDLI